MMRLLAIVILIAAAATAAGAHELRPGYLEIRQTGLETYDVRFKVPARGDLRLGLYARFPADCTTPESIRAERGDDAAFIDRFTVTCPGGLEDERVSIDGLAGTFTDVVVRVELLDGSDQTVRLTPDLPDFAVTGAPTSFETARTYFVLGVHHILLGADHLLFVLALLLLVRGPWVLVKTVTAFTVAHSITLACAAIGWAAAPQAPVEAVIALSISFLAVEIVQQGRGRDDLASRAPWAVAFAFGLLHGFGFGGALKDLGLPQSDVPLALFTFNAGVEAGQLLFVFAVIALKASLDRLLALEMPRLRDISGYSIGSLAAAWFIQRVVAMV